MKRGIDNVSHGGEDHVDGAGGGARRVIPSGRLVPVTSKRFIARQEKISLEDQDRQPVSWWWERRQRPRCTHVPFSSLLGFLHKVLLFA